MVAPSLLVAGGSYNQTRVSQFSLTSSTQLPISVFLSLLISRHPPHHCGIENSSHTRTFNQHRSTHALLSLNLTLFPLHVPVRYVTVTFIRVIAIRFLRHAFLVHSGLASSRDSQFYSLYFQSAILWDYRAMNFDWMTTKALTSRTY